MSTCLFMFWAADGVAAFLEPKEKKEAVHVASCFLPYHVTSVLLLEDMY